MRNTMKNYIKMILGLMVLFTSIWLGSWTLSIIDQDDWRQFPTFMTAMFFGFAGMIFGGCNLTKISGCVHLDEDGNIDLSDNKGEE